jgi:ribosome maturation factor RimP
VTRAVGPILDSADPIEGSYCLAVGSPGLNRELKSRAHLEKYINKEVTVRLFAKNDKTGEKNFSAVLKALGGAEANFVFELSDNTEIELTKKEIAHIYALDKIDILGRN